MKRLRSPLFLLLLAVLMVWGVSFALYLKQHVEDRLVWIPIYITAPDASDYPVIREFRPGATREVAELQIGDRLVAIGDADMRGVGPVGLQARVYEQVVPGQTLRMTIDRDRQLREIDMALVAGPSLGSTLPLVLSFAALGMLVFWRAPDSREARLGALAALVYSLYWAHFPGGPSPGITYAWLTVDLITSCVSLPLSMLGLCALLDVASSRRLGTRIWPWIFAAYGLCRCSVLLGWPFSGATGFLSLPVTDISWGCAMLVQVALSYSRADVLGRRRLKWLVYGLGLGLGPVLVGSVVALAHAPFRPYYELCILAGIAIPVCVFISVTRYQLFDIDRLISATTTYAVLTFLLVAALLILGPRVAHAAGATLGLDASTGQIAFSLVLAALVLPGYRMLRPVLDRMFFVERMALERGIGQLLAQLSSCRAPQELFTTVGQRLDALLHPDLCVIYARTGEVFVPVFAKGRVVPPAFANDSALLRRLEQSNIPLAVGDRPGPSFLPIGDEIEWAAFDSLGAAVLLPITHRGSLAAFVCLGNKRSGDVYINTDLALLSAVASKISSELRHFDLDEVRQQARAMQESMRRYVPGAVAEHLERGDELEAGTREVSVLFVDIRGYTNFSEKHSATEIFLMINRYTEAVSSVVRKHRGSIIQFSGDGLMAVFGAPEALVDKERAAIEAAYEVVKTIRALALGNSASSAEGLDVGIGIATGQAYVGNIQAVDRMIWAAIGNTINLAARLQGLSKELKAHIVIDKVTHERGGRLLSGFEPHQDTPIRGRSQTEDIFALRL